MSKENGAQYKSSKECVPSSVRKNNSSNVSRVRKLSLQQFLSRYHLPFTDH